MKKNILKLTAYLVTALPLGGVAGGMFSSCADMMETESDYVSYEKDNTLNHATDSVYSVLGIVGKMQYIADRVVLLGEVRGDLVQPTAAASADLKRLAAFDFSEENKYNNVADYYAVINNCNYFLNTVDTAMERRGKKVFIPEYAAVKSYRAWTYLQLAQAYGRVPLITRPLMTEPEARKAMTENIQNMEGICNFFIDDLKEYADVATPTFDKNANAKYLDLFIPMKALLGDLCLWAGRYQEAADWYHQFLNDRDRPRPTGTMAVRWANAQFRNVTGTYLATEDYITAIPMESRVFDGVISDLPNIMGSTLQNNYYSQLTAAPAMRKLSADQTFVLENKVEATGVIDTLVAPKTGLSYDYWVGDLRFCRNFEQTSVNVDAFSEYSKDRINFRKVSKSYIYLYRKSMIYLRYAEALNRAGYPQSAMAVLKYGLYSDNVEKYIDEVEREAAGALIEFRDEYFSEENTRGIHSRGCGESRINKYYVLPQPEEELATRQDTIDYQIPLVEDMIIDEMALEGSFEGYRFNDLMRVAMRRRDNSYLADRVARRGGERDETLYNLLMEDKNWYLPLP